MMRHGVSYRLPTWEPCTSASGSGLPPDAWPTPTVHGNNNFKGASATSGDGLMTAIKRREGWPTPNSRDRLDYAVNGETKSVRYDTPTVHGDGGSGRKGTTPKYGQLNPDWEEWLMAWPVGWTDLETPNIRLVWLDPTIDPADYGEIPRTTNRRDNRPARVKEIGNGQFPLTAAVAFHWGLCVLEIVRLSD
jgi:hypothetical protein